jgi:hypothetical protein
MHFQRQKHVVVRFIVINLAQRHEGVWKCEDMSPRILNLGTRDVDCQLPTALPLRTNKPKEQVGFRPGLDHRAGEEKICPP